MGTIVPKNIVGTPNVGFPLAVPTNLLERPTNYKYAPGMFYSLPWDVHLPIKEGERPSTKIPFQAYEARSCGVKKDCLNK